MRLAISSFFNRIFIIFHIRQVGEIGHLYRCIEEVIKESELKGKKFDKKKKR